MRRTPLIAAATALVAATTFAGTARAGLTAINPSPPGAEPSVAALLAGFSAGTASATAAATTTPAAGFTRVDDAADLRFADSASYQKVANHSVHDNAVTLSNGQFAVANAHGTLSADAAANAGGSDQMVAYRADGTDTYYLFFEDTPGAFADLDFNDAVVRVDASAVMVPAPPAVLVGAMMLGAVGVRSAAKRLRRRNE